MRRQRWAFLLKISPEWYIEDDRYHYQEQEEMVKQLSVLEERLFLARLFFSTFMIMYGSEFNARVTLWNLREAKQETRIEISR